MRIRVYLVSASLVIFILSSVSFAFSNFFYLFMKSSNQGNIEWISMGATPLGEKKYTPQGMVFVGQTIVFANSWKDARSRVYEINPETMKIMRFFDMPDGAVHTSGLSWDGIFLWGVDHATNKAYCMDLEASFEKKKAVLKGSFSTTLKGTSASCFLMFKGKSYLAISDFMNTSQTIFVDVKKAFDEGTAENAIVFAYKNEGFSQGLAFIDGFLYESENKIGTNIINKMDMKKLELTRSARKATIIQYPAPSWGVEDLAWNGKEIWTSDETTYSFYKGIFASP